jgi:hypothetical protein
MLDLQYAAVSPTDVGAAWCYGETHVALHNNGSGTLVDVVADGLCPDLWLLLSHP